MNYLFFDIECANCDGGNGKICSFGYVLTDESFNVIAKQDMVINPKAKFKLRGRGKDYITLAYSKETFNNALDFSEYYDDIARLLTAEDTLVFGYAPENDAGFLRSEFERYQKPCVAFVFYDVQRIFRDTMAEQGANLCSLSVACESVGIASEVANHKSCDDAYATMLVLKAVCASKSVLPTDFAGEESRYRGWLKDGEIGASYFKPKVEILPGEENYIKGVNRDNFRYLQRRLSGRQLEGTFQKKRICFSWLYEFKHYREMLWILKAISDNGGRYTHKISECDIFVKKPKGIRGVCRRQLDAEIINEASSGKKPIIIEFSEFLSRIDTDADKLSENSQKMNFMIEDLKKGIIG